MSKSNGIYTVGRSVLLFFGIYFILTLAYAYFISVGAMKTEAYAIPMYIELIIASTVAASVLNSRGNAKLIYTVYVIMINLLFALCITPFAGKSALWVKGAVAILIGILFGIILNSKINSTHKQYRKKRHH